MVFCSITDDEDTAIRALRAGAVGYVRKDLDYEPSPAHCAARWRRGGDFAPARHTPDRRAVPPGRAARAPSPAGVR